MDWSGGAKVPQNKLLQLCCHCSSSEEKRPLYFPGGKSFSLFSEKQFHSQNNLSFLDKTPCYIYPTKIADDTLYTTPALWHMALSITPVTRAGLPDNGNPGSARQSDRERQRNEIKGSEKGWETLWGLILFPLPVALLWTESEWNYCAFIRQTAGPLWSLKAT